MNSLLPNKKLTPFELSIVPEAFTQLLIQRIKVSFLPSRKYMPASVGNISSSATNEKIASAKIIAGVINGLSIRTPFTATCLVKVLATHKMLSKRNIAHAIHCGVHINPIKKLSAHAWLSVAGKILIGGGQLGQYKEISRVDL
jgi:hypothetical protein